jgi:hypothetical protein
MPGIYVNDGGATSSAIGNILGGIAQEVGPEGAAKAALLQQQTQGADISNQDAYEKLLAGEAAANAAAGLTRTLNMNAPDPGQPSVAGTVTSLSQPPSATPGPGGRISRIDESGFTPEQKYLANEIINGRMSPAALQTGVDVFQTPLVGAGMTPSAIRTRATTPISPGQVIPVTGVPGGPTISGGSEYTSTGEKAGAGADDALAAKDLEVGANAKADLGRLDLIDQLYNRIDQLGSNDPAEIGKDLVVKKLSDSLGMDLSRFSNLGAIKQSIRSVALGLTGTLRTSEGEPLPKGALTSIEALSPNPEAPAAEFHRMTSVIRAMEQRMAGNFDAALKFRTDRPRLGDQAGTAYHTQRGANASTEANTHASLGFKPESNDTPTAPPPPKVDLSQELVYARDALNHGAKRADIIARAKQRGVDLEALGF